MYIYIYIYNIERDKEKEKEIDVNRYIDIYLRINDNRQQNGVFLTVHNSQR